MPAGCKVGQLSNSRLQHSRWVLLVWESPCNLASVLVTLQCFDGCISVNSKRWPLLQLNYPISRTRLLIASPRETLPIPASKSPRPLFFGSSIDLEQPSAPLLSRHIYQGALQSARYIPGPRRQQHCPWWEQGPPPYQRVWHRYCPYPSGPSFIAPTSQHGLPWTDFLEVCVSANLPWIDDQAHNLRVLEMHFADDPVENRFAGPIGSHGERTHLHPSDTAHWASDADELGPFALLQ